MAVFVYVARRRNGEKAEGTVEAADRRAALAQLEASGLIPVRFEEKSAAAAKPAAVRERFTWRRGKHRMGTRELLLFTTELSDLLASGMTLGNALNSLARRQTAGASGQLITMLRDDIIRGASLSESLARQPETFSNLYVSMIRAGEASGTLAEILQRLVEHYERVQQTREKVVMALVYPGIVMTLGFATLVFSMLSVVPKFEVIFSQMNAALPLPTRMLIGISSWMVRYGWLMVIAIVVGVTFAQRALKTEKGRRWRDGLILRTPLIRGIVASGIFANFANTLGVLLSNGVPALQALGIVEKTVGNLVIGDEIHKARERVTDGTSISGPLAAGKIFPPTLIDMLAVGEQTGDMSSSLKHIARRYENDLDRNVKIFTTALEPILIVFVALMVGFVAVSILMAVFSLTNGLNV